MISNQAGRRLVTRGDGNCSSPLGATPFDFSVVCARHDLGYDLLRYAAHRGDPLGGWARRAIDDQFVDGLAARCRDQPATGLACATTAALYTAVVRLNTWRQGDGAPLTEDSGRWVIALAAGICVGLGVTRRWHRSPRGWRGDRTMNPPIRALDPSGALVALLAAVLSLGPSLLPPGAAWDPTTRPPPATAARALLHPDDPVGWWSPRLLMQRPAGWSGQWLPIVSFWQVTGSLLGALTAPPGHGHRYGDELVDAWRSVGCDAALSPDRLAAMRAAVDSALDIPVPQS